MEIHHDPPQVDHEDRPRRYRIVGGPLGRGEEVLALRYTGTASNLEALGAMLGHQLQGVTDHTAVFTNTWHGGQRQVEVGEWGVVPVRGPLHLEWIDPERFAAWYAPVEEHDQAAAT